MHICVSVIGSGTCLEIAKILSRDKHVPAVIVTSEFSDSVPCLSALLSEYNITSIPAIEVCDIGWANKEKHAQDISVKKSLLYKSRNYVTNYQYKPIDIPKLCRRG